MQEVLHWTNFYVACVRRIFVHQIIMNMRIEDKVANNVDIRVTPLKEIQSPFENNMTSDKVA